MTKIKKLVILAGGLGTRISEETERRPKPMVDIGGKPIIWHIMKFYNEFGIREFIICCGYKGYIIKNYFLNYLSLSTDMTIDMKTAKTTYHSKSPEDWKITLVDTGDHTMTGGRIKRVASFIDGEDFYLTYGDGLADVDIEALTNHHFASGKKATVTAVQPPGRFGALQLDGTTVTGFQEKIMGDGGWINGGFFVVSNLCLELLEDDMTIWENEPMTSLAKDSDLNAYLHKGFWQPMDTLREKNILEEKWQNNQAPWKIWKC